MLGELRACLIGRETARERNDAQNAGMRDQLVVMARAHGDRQFEHDLAAFGQRIEAFENLGKQNVLTLGTVA